MPIRTTRGSRACLWLSISFGLACAGGAQEGASPTTTPVAAAEAGPTDAPAEAGGERPTAAAPEKTQLTGKWVWHELMTRDADAAGDFYQSLFGWTSEETEVGGQTTFILKNGEQRIGRIVPTTKGKEAHWIGFVSVPSVDEAVASARDAGAKNVDAEPTDIPDVARLAHVVDPLGATFGLRTAVHGDGPDAQPGEFDFCWDELWVKRDKDKSGAVTFYGKTVGYTEQPFGEGAKPYLMLAHGQTPRAGIERAARGAFGGRWVPYVVVDDVDEILADARELKAKQVVRPTEVPGVGRFAVIQDPQKALIGIITPARSEP